MLKNVVFYRGEPSKYAHFLFYLFSLICVTIKKSIKRGNLYLGKGLHLGFNYTMYELSWLHFDMIP